jgi:nucleotide-binding universal stress UspA family protein
LNRRRRCTVKVESVYWQRTYTLNQSFKKKLDMVELKKFRTVICPTDFSEPAKLVLDNAIKFAEITGCELDLLNIVDDSLPEYATYRRDEKGRQTLHRTLETDSQNRLKSLADLRIRNANQKRNLVTAFGKAIDQIPKVSVAKPDTLVMLPTKSSMMTEKFALGGTTYKIIRTSPVPVLVFSRPAVKFKASKILYGTDFSLLSYKSFGYAVNLAKEFDAELHIVHSHQSNTGGKVALRELDTLTREAKAHGLVRVTPSEIPIGKLPGEGLAGYAKQNMIDLCVISTHGMNGYKQFFLGSTAVDLVSRSEAPVMLVRVLGENKPV